VTDLMTERYGRTSPRRRALVIAVSGVVGVVALAWLGWATWFQSTPDVQSTMRSFRVVDTHGVEATVSVKTRSPDVEASCRLRAIAFDHSVVGERNVKVSGTSGTVRLVVPFRTEREATSVELVGCTSADQARPR
jgi:hypothetical protein